MVNGISEKGLSVNYKVKIVNFRGSTSEKIQENLDNLIKEKTDLIFHAGTNDITNDVNLSSNVKKIFNNFSKESSNSSIKKELVLLITMVLRNFISISFHLAFNIIR